MERSRKVRNTVISHRLFEFFSGESLCPPDGKFMRCSYVVYMQDLGLLFRIANWCQNLPKSCRSWANPAVELRLPELSHGFDGVPRNAPAGLKLGGRPPGLHSDTYAETHLGHDHRSTSRDAVHPLIMPLFCALFCVEHRTHQPTNLFGVS